MTIQRALVYAVALLALADSASAALTAHFTAATGDYRLISDHPAWQLSGRIGVPCTALPDQEGTDRIGAFAQTSVRFRVNGVPVIASIRTYAARPVALFALQYTAPSDAAVAAFPDFVEMPSGLNTLVFTDRVFAPPGFNADPGPGPLLAFSSKFDSLVISPANHFFLQRLSGNGIHQIACQLNSQFWHIPAGFTQETLIAIGPGVNHTWDVWGHALTDLQGKHRPPNNADLPLSHLGYWTDHGAFYYYSYDPKLGYEGTLLKLADYFKRKAIPVGYMQLDSWWYEKTFTAPDGKPGKQKSNGLPAGPWNRYGGLLEYKADPAVFPDGLAGFQKKLGLPLITHNRWIDPASPYRRHYRISGIVAIDPRWWHDVMTYLKSSGVVTYEQDWLSEIDYHSLALNSTTDAANQFLDSMAAAAKAAGMSLQYCMELPAYYLQASRYSNLTTIRVSDDSFSRVRWHDFLYVSRLASAVGCWPWADVCQSTDTGSLLLQTLSGGMVGFGDKMGAESTANLAMTARADGVLVKPDVPIVPLDSSYLAEARKKHAALVASTYTLHHVLRTAYVFAYSDDPTVKTAKFSIAELGFSGPVFVYDYFTGRAARVAAGGSFSGNLTPDHIAYYVVAPVTQSGIAFFGDAGKFVSTGKQRIAAIKVAADQLTVTVLLAQGESTVRLHGCANFVPLVSVDGGTSGKVTYTEADSQFAVDVSAHGGTRVITVIFAPPRP